MSEKIGANHRDTQLTELFFHIRTAELKLMIANSNDVVTHRFHYIGYILTLRDRPYRATLEEVTTTDYACPGSITLIDGITQTRKFRIA